MEGLAEGPRKAAAEPYGEMMWQRLARNPLKSPESDEGIQINPRESKPVSLVLLGLAWVWLGKIWPGARPPITFARLVYEDAPRWAPSPASFYFREKAGNVSPCWRFAVYSS